jgi:hypothetical protein
MINSEDIGIEHLIVIDHVITAIESKNYQLIDNMIKNYLILNKPDPIFGWILYHFTCEVKACLSDDRNKLKVMADIGCLGTGNCIYLKKTIIEMRYLRWASR